MTERKEERHKSFNFLSKKKCERDVMAPHLNAEQNTSDQVLFCFFQHGGKKKNSIETSLEIQWLTLHTSKAGARV